MAAKNLLDLTNSLIGIHHKLNNPKYVSLGAIEILSSKLNSWHDEVISSGLSQRRTYSRLITDLKYLVGSVEGADELFMEIDELTSPIRQDWTPKVSGDTGKNLRKTFLDLILIIDPDIKGSVQSNNRDFEVIQQRLKEVERKSLTFLDMNSKIFQIRNGKVIEKKIDSNRNIVSSSLLSVDSRRSTRRILKSSERIHSAERKPPLPMGMVTSTKIVKMNEVRTPLGVRSNNVNIYQKITPVKHENNYFPLKRETYGSSRAWNSKNSSNFASSQRSLRGMSKILSEPNLLSSATKVSKENKENAGGYNSKKMGQSLRVSLNFSTQTFKVPEGGSFQKDSLQFGSKQYQTNQTNQTFSGVHPKPPLPNSTTPIKIVQSSNNQQSINLNSKSKNQQQTVQVGPPSPLLDYHTLKIPTYSSSTSLSQENSTFRNRLQDYYKKSGPILPQNILRHKSPSPSPIQNKRVRTPMKSTFKASKHHTPRVLDSYPNNPGTPSVFRIGNHNSNSKLLSSTRSNHFTQRSVSPLQKTTMNPLLSSSNRKLAHTPIKTPSKFIGRNLYTGGSQATTPMKVEFVKNEVSSYTPYKLAGPKKTGYGSPVGDCQNSGFNIGKFLASRNSEKLHIKIPGIQKIVLSNDKNYLIFGGKGLHVLDMSNAKFKLIRYDKKQKWKFNTIKVLKNDHILITQPQTNDLIVLDTNFKEITRLNGLHGDSFDNEAIRNSRYSNEGDNFIWFRGGNKISIVNTLDLSVKDIDIPSIHSLPLAVTANNPLTKLIALTVVEDENIYLNYWEKGSNIISRSLNNVCSSMKAAMALEISEDQKTVFVGGCDTMNVFNGKACLSAVNFNKYMVQVCSIQLHDPSMKNIFQIKRIPGKNVLVVGGFNSISLIEFKPNNKIFLELKQLKNLHSGEIFDFVIRGREIYSVCEKDEYVHKF